MIGGESRNSNTLKSVERININDLTTAESEWETVVSMNQEKDGCTAALHNKTIYVFGGIDDNSPRGSSTAELYDTTKPNEGWKTIPNIIKPHPMRRKNVDANFGVIIISCDLHLQPPDKRNNYFRGNWNPCYLM